MSKTPKYEVPKKGPANGPSEFTLNLNDRIDIQAFPKDPEKLNPLQKAQAELANKRKNEQLALHIESNRTTMEALLDLKTEFQLGQLQNAMAAQHA